MYIGENKPDSDIFLQMDKRLIGQQRTRSWDSLITDSAAGATSFATGYRTVNNWVSVDHNKKPVATLFEAAKNQLGKKIGLVKIKFDEYKRLHRLMSGVSTKSIWELLKEGKTVVELIEHVPDEFYDWVKATEKDLMSQFRAIENTAKAEYKTFETRKETASYFLTCTYPAVLFSMLDQKDYAPKIWYHIRPKYEKPFSERNL